MRGLYKDLSVQELMQMREEGMSNREIAEALDITRQTVLRYIGKQPPGITSRTLSESKMTVGGTGMRRPYLQKPAEEEPEASLIVENKKVTLMGEILRYNIDQQKQTIRITDQAEQQTIDIEIKDIGKIIAELKAIQNHQNEIKMNNELW